MSIDYGMGLISKLVETKDFRTVKDQQIKPSFFTGDNSSVFDFIQENFLEHGEVPTERVLKDQFPYLKLMKNPDGSIGTEEGLLFWCNELRKETKHRLACDAIQKSADKLNGLETEEAVVDLRKQLAYIDNEISVSSIVDITKDTEDRVEAYNKRRITGGVEGISTGFSSLDLVTGGLCPETLTTIIAKTSVGKEQPVSSMVLTSEGYKKMGDIVAGDLVFNEFGHLCPVSDVYPQGIKDVYEITFDDGSKVRCGKDHLWKFKTQDDRSHDNDWRVDTLENVMKFPLKRGRGYNLVIPVCRPVQFRKRELSIDPYSLGALLGDGGFTTDSISFTNTEDDVVERCAKGLPYVDFIQNGKCNYRYLLRKPEGSYLNPLISRLRELDLWGCRGKDKFVPDIYKYSSEQDRRDILAGLLDTDGSVDNGQISFSTSSNQLADDVVFLCNSLGYRARKNSYQRDERPNIEYIVNIRTDEVLTYSFKHSKKYGKGSAKNHYYNVMKIVSIELIGQEESQCIAVYTPSHTYLTDNFIVTHNTWLQTYIGAFCMLNGYKVLQGVTEMSTTIMRDRYEAMLFSMMYGGLDYTLYKQGKLPPDVYNQFVQFLKEDLPSLEPLLLRNVTGIINLRADIEDIKPDIILIDGVYMMEDDRGAKDDWLRIAHITRDLKRACKDFNLPVCINTQTDINSKGGLGGVRYSKAINEDSDTVLELIREDTMFTDNEAKLISRKNREGVQTSIMLDWNFSPLHFGEIYSETSSGTKDDSESYDNSPMIGVD